MTDDNNNFDEPAITPGGIPRDPLGDPPAVGNDEASDPAASGVQSPPGLDEEKDFERRNPGS